MPVPSHHPLISDQQHRLPKMIEQSILWCFIRQIVPEIDRDHRSVCYIIDWRNLMVPQRWQVKSLAGMKINDDGLTGWWRGNAKWIGSDPPYFVCRLVDGDSKVVIVVFNVAALWELSFYTGIIRISWQKVGNIPSRKGYAMGGNRWNRLIPRIWQYRFS